MEVYTKLIPKIYIYIVLDVLECRIAEYFYGLYRVINYPTGFFFPAFFCLVFLLISHKAGKAKRIEKRRARSRLIKQVFFTYKITNCPNNRTISQDICSLFARYLYSTLCSWITILIIDIYGKE